LTTTDPLASAAAAEAAHGVVLVTGATGFLGQHVVAALRARGTPVRALGLELDVGLKLAAAGVDFRPVDLRDRTAMIAACRGVEKVIHSGALASAWGDYEDFYAINVHGTENVIAGCRAHGVRRLVHISTCSVLAEVRPLLNLDDTRPIPAEFLSYYAQTKALAEQRIHAAQEAGLATVILRPRAIYGPGDRALLPRLTDAIKRGRVLLIGDGETLVNVTHVSDMTRAILLALDASRAVGRTYAITGGEDVNLWDIARAIAERLGVPPPRRRLSAAAALWLGRAMEVVWGALQIRREPPLTRYKAAMLAYSQTLDISRARAELGYEPKVRWRDGLAQFMDSAAAPAPAAAEPAVREPAATVKLTVLRAGATHAPERLFGLSRSWRRVKIPALFAVIEHPRRGVGLFDTGYSTRFYEATERWPDRIYSWLTPVRVTPEEDAEEQLARRGWPPEDVRWIVLSHFDPDHIGGLRDFPNARILCSWRAWREIAGKSGVAALRERVLTDLLPTDLAARLLLLPDPNGPPLGPLGPTFDLFGDGAVQLVGLPGHHTGMLGAMIAADSGRRVLLCADACWTMKAIEDPVGARGVHPWLAKDRAAQRATYEKLRRLRSEAPDLEILPSHCPEAAKRFVR
jgi:nucleoside-diphosphate-sugar epimerase/glyoxylase-like metal-dependent hydrolase (beta-lactamase superfamily II)